MRIKKTRLTIITNLVLAFVLVCVAVVSFLPQAVAPVNSDHTVKPIYNGNRAFKRVSLMFNVYENSKIVEGIVEELNSRNLKATFFVGGCWADDNGDLLTKMVEDGHEIANHGYFHKDHKKLSYDGNVQEIKLTGSIVKALCGAETTLFAPPSGSFGNNTLIACSELGYKVIMWSKDTIDWRDSNQDLIIKRATTNVSNGDLVLMHPKPHSLSALPKILDYFAKIGLEQVKVSQNILEN